jgi:hypothetical protein
MAQYISKDALVAEIERRIKERDFQMKSGCWISSTYMYEDLLDFINTLEEKDANEALRTEYEKGRADTIKEFQDALINHQGHTTKGYKKKDINFISDKEYLDRAIDFIIDREEENDYICEKLHEIPEEFKICSEDCQNLDHWCILRFLKHYKIKHLYESK